MSEINELGERVATAEERFRFINEVQNKHSERLLGLLNKLKSELDETRHLHSQQKQEIERLTQANEALRALLHNLLQAVENFNNSDAFHGIERKAAGLLSPDSKARKDVKSSGEVSDISEARRQISRAASAEEQAARKDKKRVDDAGNEVVEMAGDQPKIPTFFLRKENPATTEADA